TIGAHALRSPQLRAIERPLVAAEHLVSGISSGGRIDDKAKALAAERRGIPAICLWTVVDADDARLAGFHGEDAIGHALLGKWQADAQRILDLHYGIARFSRSPGQVEVYPLLA